MSRILGFTGCCLKVSCFDFWALLIKGMNFSLTQRRKDAKVRFLKVQFGNFIPRFSNADFWLSIFICVHLRLSAYPSGSKLQLFLILLLDY